MNWKYFLGIGLLIILFLYIVCYPLQFEFYENIQAKKLADFIFVPFYGILVFYDLYKNIAKKEKNWKKYLFDFLKSTTFFSIAYLLFLRWFFSCFLLLLNAIFGEKEVIKISGPVTEIVHQKGSGKFLGNHTLSIQQDGKSFVFDAKGVLLENYKEGEYTELKMKKGVLNLLYR